MTVGAFDMVSGGSEVMSGIFVEEAKDGLELVRVERLITMTVVESPPSPD
jgi:hypothetical protein